MSADSLVNKFELTEVEYQHGDGSFQLIGIIFILVVFGQF